MNDKIIVTNLSSLKRKYGNELKNIATAIEELIKTDRKRGLQTRLVAIDDAQTMKQLKAPRVSDASDPEQNKDAVDAVYKALAPDYILLLGSLDVIPHQSLKNPVYDGLNDADRFVPSDLPYACEAPYSRKPEDFTGPARVVGRLPDLTGGEDAAYLIALLETAAGWKSSAADKYVRHLGISAWEWADSTRMSLKNLFGSSAKIQTSPPKGPKWSSTLLRKPSHFINCHGAPADFHFYGQKGDSYPVAHDASYLEGRVAEGTVVAAECCYGAALYDARKLADGQAGICSTYLAGKAYGFFGSTTIAYGPAEGNGSADLISQYFLKHVLAGDSLGRAALEAQQEFAVSSPELDPVDLKTLVQFVLFGDPSIHPVTIPTPHKAVDTTKGLKTLSLVTAGPATGRAGRRLMLASKGLWIAGNQPVAGNRLKTTPDSVEPTLRELAKKLRIENYNTLSFGVAREPKLLARAAKAPARRVFHVILGSKKGAQVKAKKAGKQPVRAISAVVAREVDGTIVSFRELYGRTTVR
jgi:hypothetical protein